MDNLFNIRVTIKIANPTGKFIAMEKAVSNQKSEWSTHLEISIFFTHGG